MRDFNEFEKLAERAERLPELCNCILCRHLILQKGGRKAACDEVPKGPVVYHYNSALLGALTRKARLCPKYDCMKGGL